MTSKDLQRILVLCIAVAVGVYGGYKFANTQVTPAQTQIDPPSLELEPAPSETEVEEMPKVEPGDTPAPLPGEAEQPLLTPEDPVACTMDAKQCTDGSYVGRVAPNCEFAPCPTPPADGATYCDPDNRPEICTDIYAPVCAQVQVECFTTPCEPVPQTFGNNCNACANDRVISYVEGACE